jgi:pimeloyl-ACP methyl ester carboxylesterase
VPGIRRSTAIAFACAAGFALAAVMPAATATAREVREAVATPPAAGPAQYNQVFVDKYGPENGKRVLVLMPGTSGGSGDFTLMARYMVKKVPGLQVWAIDRRTQALERTEMFERALAGTVTLQQMFDHYLGWTANGGNPSNHFQFLEGDDYPFVREWGMETALNDARAVVLQARGRGRSRRSVALGGHSLGASLTAAYASWDFNGTPGYQDIDGMVLIDGGLMGSFDSYDVNAAQKAITELSTSSPFADLLGAGIPEVAGLFGEIGGIFALKAPHESAKILQDFLLLPRAFNPPYEVTNQALLGYAFDRDSSPEELALLHINAGALALSGTPRDWTDGGVTPIHRLAFTFGQEPANAIEWYFPKRLTIDTNGANALAQNDVANLLGLRLFHQPKVDIPLYALQTDLTKGRVLQGATNFIASARTTRKESLLVNADPEQAHLDPLMAATKQNKFFTTVTPFLRYKVFGERKKSKAREAKKRKQRQAKKKRAQRKKHK